MKRIICLGLALLTVVALITGCGAKQEDRLLYNDVKLSKYVQLGEYKGIAVDTSSSEFTTMSEDIMSDDVTNYNLYVVSEKGYVVKGDTANIDYVGKKDGVAFEGGTAEGYDLEIGSGSFIEGFEEGLIGAEIGSTIDLNLTFPEDYQSEDLAGADVVFTVTINYVTTTTPLTPEEYYQDLGFESVDAYRADVKERTINSYLLEKLTADSKITEYPEEDLEYLYESYKKSMESTISSQYGIDFATYLSYMGQTEEAFKSSLITEQLQPIMQSQMVLYCIFDEEELEFTKEEVDDKVKETIASTGDTSITEDYLKELYGEFYFEQTVVSEKVLDFVYDNATIS